MLLPKTITLATRKSQLAIAQTKLVAQHLKQKLPDHNFEILPMSTTGDRQLSWSLENKGGKGLFTKELEDALLNNQAHIAVHSAKDLPTENPDGLKIAGFLPRETATDVLVKKTHTTDFNTVATGSPRRRAQGASLFPTPPNWIEIRGNIQTRMNKIIDGSHGQATFMAAAALKRLGIDTYEGLEFQPLTLNQMVPAVGQGAIALQCPQGLEEALREQLCPETYYAVTVERTLLSAFGGGCHVAYAGHFVDNALHVYHPNCGIKQFPFKGIELEEVPRAVEQVVEEIKHG